MVFLTLIPTASVSAARNNLSGIKIVVDPGHGGHDPGAVGPSGLAEKNVVLSVARYLRNYLAGAGARVILTRNRDKFIPLAHRAEIANKAKARTFVSVHINSSPNKGANKTETYFHKKSAARLASSVQSRMFKGLGNENNGTHLAGFAVIRRTKMKGILTEGSFISNAREEARLKRDTYRRKMARSIYEGLKDAYGLKRKAQVAKVETVVKEEAKIEAKPVVKVEKNKSFLTKTVEGLFSTILPPVDEKQTDNKESVLPKLTVDNSTTIPFLETINNREDVSKLEAPVIANDHARPVRIKNTSEKEMQPEIKLYNVIGQEVAKVEPMIEKDKDFEFHPSNLGDNRGFTGSIEITAPEAQIETENAATITE